MSTEMQPDPSGPSSGPLGTLAPAVRLVSIRRTVSPDRLTAYHTAWTRLRDAVIEEGGKAWLFHASDRPEMHLEFLESRRLSEIAERDDVASAIQALDRDFGPGVIERWEDAPLNPES